MITEEKNIEYQKAIEMHTIFYESKKPKIICSYCNLEINYNGVSTHFKIHKNIYYDRYQQIKKSYNTFNFCVVCSKALDGFYHGKRTRRQMAISFCSFTCLTKAKKDITDFLKYKKKEKKCSICNKIFYSNRLTCSTICGRLKAAQSIKEWHETSKETSSYKLRIEKISKARNFEKYLKAHGPWNKNLKGDAYLKHYDKPDGSNSLIEGMKKSNFLGKKTKPEIIFETFLKDNNFDYRYSVFHMKKQFDFSIRFNNFMLITEVDGDYWHGSRFHNNVNEEKRNQLRKNDLMKNEIIEINNNKQFKMNRSWFIVRLWESDIYKNMSFISKLFLEIKKNEDNLNEVKNIICKIKEYYSKKC